MSSVWWKFGANLAPSEGEAVLCSLTHTHEHRCRWSHQLHPPTCTHTHTHPRQSSSRWEQLKDIQAKWLQMGNDVAEGQRTCRLLPYLCIYVFMQWVVAGGGVTAVILALSRRRQAAPSSCWPRWSLKTVTWPAGWIRPQLVGRVSRKHDKRDESEPAVAHLSSLCFRWDATLANVDSFKG